MNTNDLLNYVRSTGIIFPHEDITDMGYKIVRGPIMHTFPKLTHIYVIKGDLHKLTYYFLEYIKNYDLKLSVLPLEEEGYVEVCLSMK